MKQCVTCGESKLESEYNWRYKSKGIKSNTCRSCQSKQKKRWYENNKEEHIKSVAKNRKAAIKTAQQYVWDYLSTRSCVDCGESNPVVLEFDHVRGRKKMSVSNLAKEGYSIKTIQKEIEKCEIRCANCHRIKTHKERGWFRG
jgi:hypothetical protein